MDANATASKDYIQNTLLKRKNDPKVYKTKNRRQPRRHSWPPQRLFHMCQDNVNGIKIAAHASTTYEHKIKSKCPNLSQRVLTEPVLSYKT